ncbi:MAG TPA: RNA polymerase sigma-70 factor [Gammaproteobacteria bacterium]|nr:RNA polymerase sigma-70 factor [Gammaproteobacteria bacterium]
MDERTATFEQHRPKLYGIAYRMLGTRADAEDMLQETYLRWHQTDLERVRSPEAWLTTIIARLCIDRLRSAHSERAAYSGPWLPEPLVGADAPMPEAQSELASDLSVAFLVVLERLAPNERAAFLLHDVFDCDYSEVAQILGKSEPTCRQIVHRARERVRRERPRFQVSETARRRLLERLIAAVQTADREALLALFAEDATWTADGGGKTPAASKVLQGGARVAKLVFGLARHLARRKRGRYTFHLVPINGETGILTCLDGQPAMALSIMTDGVRILAGYNVVNPEKLQRVAATAAVKTASRCSSPPT